MKITKKQLGQIIREEIEKASEETGLISEEELKHKEFFDRMLAGHPQTLLAIQLADEAQRETIELVKFIRTQPALKALMKSQFGGQILDRLVSAEKASKDANSALEKAKSAGK